MIDTCEMGYFGLPPGPAEHVAFAHAVVGNMEVRSVGAAADAVLKPTSWAGWVPGLGRVRYGADGYLRFGGSLSRYRECFDGRPLQDTKNDDVLTARSANETLQELCSRAEHVFVWLHPGALNITRADVVYQRAVKSSAEVLMALQGVIKQTRLGCAWFDNAQGVATGLHLRGDWVSHRIYDKGLEGGNEAYKNVLRSEEQLRHKSRAFKEIVDLEQRTFSRAACLETMNERYADAVSGGQIDVSELIRAGRPELALLVSRPELISVYRETVKKSAYHAMRKAMREYRGAAVPADMRVPENAWLDDAAS